MDPRDTSFPPSSPQPTTHLSGGVVFVLALLGFGFLFLLPSCVILLGLSM